MVAGTSWIAVWLHSPMTLADLTTHSGWGSWLGQGIGLKLCSKTVERISTTGYQLGRLHSVKCGDRVFGHRK